MYSARIGPLFTIFLLIANLNQPSSWGPLYVSSSLIHPFNSSEMYDDKYLKPPRSEIYQRFACSNLFPPLFMTFVEHLWAFYHSLPKGGVFHLYPASFREWRSFALPRFPPNERSAFGARGFAPPSETTFLAKIADLTLVLSLCLALATDRRTTEYSYSKHRRKASKYQLSCYYWVPTEKGVLSWPIQRLSPLVNSNGQLSSAWRPGIFFPT